MKKVDGITQYYKKPCIKLTNGENVFLITLFK